ncbi:MAG TPA: succinate dehydrogenase hydrophobic membrane anchor subunit [Arthrobacter sp.]|nr:succinate dehydrogenase hydrophobic membrane anchor subunit [Arthrobacter sp.]
MAQIIQPPRSYDNARAGTKYNRSGSTGTNFEMLGWVFMRVTGIALLVLIFVHLYVNLMVGDGVQAIDFGFVAGKWADPFWQMWDLTMLWLAMLHGTNGVRTVINDYADEDSTRFWLKVILYSTTVVIVLLGTLVIFTFNPCPAAADPSLLPSFCPAG